VDPHGNNFFSLGINLIEPTEQEKVKGRKYDGLSRHQGSLGEWRAFTLRRLEAWNFNTIGAWSSLRGKPYVVELSLSYRWIDVFGEGFEKYVRRAAQEALRRSDIASDYAALAGDSMLVGYFTDNELAWGSGYGWSGKSGDLSLFEYYATLEPEAPGKKAWAAYLAGAYGADFAKLRRIWKVDASDEQDLLAVTEIAPRSPEYQAEARRVADGFLRLAAERYFQVTSRLMRGYLPNHLNLGTRLTPHFPSVVAETAGKYGDVLSFNVYSRDLDFVQAELSRLHRAGKKPVLVSEFSFPARENRSGNTNGGYDQAEVQNDAERGRYYARWLETIGELPFVVGCHWFGYFDQPSGGRADGESCNFGFVDLEDRVYEMLASQASAANARALQRYRWAADAGTTPPSRIARRLARRAAHVRVSGPPGKARFFRGRRRWPGPAGLLANPRHTTQSSNPFDRVDYGSGCAIR